MQCHKCGSQVPGGMAFCQECGTPLSPPSPSSIAPTIAAAQPPYGTPGSNYNSSSLPPTVAASQPPYGTPGADANYNPSSLPPTVAAGQPPYAAPGPYTNYNPSSVPGSDPAYGATPNPYANVPYGQPQSGNVPPPPSNVPPYNPPPQGSAGSYGPAVPAFTSPTPVKRKSKVGLIVGIVLAVLVVACIGSTVLVTSLSRNKTGSQETTVGSTPTVAPTPTPSTPSGNTIDPTASSIVTNIKMASAIDPTSYQPTTFATRFKTHTAFYTSFQFDLNQTSVSQQNPGYVESRYYIGSRVILSGDPLKADDTIEPTGYGYFSVEYYQATTAGTVELYWCRQSDCNDGKLAGTASFTVY